MNSPIITLVVVVILFGCFSCPSAELEDDDEELCLGALWSEELYLGIGSSQ